MTMRRITVAFTGASGMPYGLRLLECLLAADVAVDLVYSTAAQIVARQECDLTLPTQPREAAQGAPLRRSRCPEAARQPQERPARS